MARKLLQRERAIKSLNMYKGITMGEYCSLREKGAPWAIPTMFVLTIKPDKMLNTHRAKSHIVVLGNHKD
jgi:hypothetical protein